MQSIKSSKNGFVEISVSIEMFVFEIDEVEEEEDDAFDDDEATGCDVMLFDLLDVRVDE